MVALLVLATFVLFIAVDVLLHREKYQFQVEREAVKPLAHQVSSPVVAGVAHVNMLLGAVMPKVLGVTATGTGASICPPVRGSYRYRVVGAASTTVREGRRTRSRSLRERERPRGASRAGGVGAGKAVWRR